MKTCVNRERVVKNSKENEIIVEDELGHGTCGVFCGKGLIITKKTIHLHSLQNPSCDVLIIRITMKNNDQRWFGEQRKE